MKLIQLDLHLDWIIENVISSIVRIKLSNNKKYWFCTFLTICYSENTSANENGLENLNLEYSGKKKKDGRDDKTNNKNDVGHNITDWHKNEQKGIEQIEDFIYVKWCSRVDILKP